MAQLNFWANFPMIVGQGNLNVTVLDSLRIGAFNLSGSLSWATANLAFSKGAGTASNSIYLGLYSLNGNTLSLANSMSGSLTIAGQRMYKSLADISAAQNITPGTWYLGLLISNGAGGSAVVFGGQEANPANAFPGLFNFGRMTATTVAMPGSIATSDLDITGQDAMLTSYIILSG